MIEHTGFGQAPLRFSEIAACAPWATEQERHLIRAMSRAYLEGSAIGSDAFGIPPWEGDEA